MNPSTNLLSLFIFSSFCKMLKLLNTLGFFRRLFLNLWRSCRAAFLLFGMPFRCPLSNWESSRFCNCSCQYPSGVFKPAIYFTKRQSFRMFYIPWMVTVFSFLKWIISVLKNSMCKLQPGNSTAFPLILQPSTLQKTSHVNKCFVIFGTLWQITFMQQ